MFPVLIGVAVFGGAVWGYFSEDGSEQKKKVKIPVDNSCEVTAEFIKKAEKEAKEAQKFSSDHIDIIKVNFSVLPNITTIHNMKIPHLRVRFLKKKFLEEDKKYRALKKDIQFIDNFIINEFEGLTQNITGFSNGENIILNEELKKSIIEKNILTKKEFGDLENLVKEMQESKPKISAIGLLKAGKSTLLNCLTNNTKDEEFKTGVIRETIKNKKYEYNQMIFVDTPGLDANEADEEETEKAIKFGDIILFVHNLKGGELDEPEVKFLEKIHSNYEDNKEFISKTIFVLSHFDEVEKELDDVETRVNQQISEIFKENAIVIKVGSKSYIKGVNENKTKLMNSSNYLLLKEEINKKTKSSYKNKSKRFKKKSLEKMQEFVNKIKILRSELDDKKNNILEEKEVEVEKIKKEIQKSNEIIRNYYHKFR
ncbi:hypothetical protein C0585_01800 [Candidatus Woesearchaeota archaeon]|nr:MAG: hypothetical protein C0585_01800 [Candidatus Woesearchaeota archaeon]